MTAYSFDPEGKIIATIDDKDVCMLTDVDTGSYVLHVRFPHEFNSSTWC